MTQVIGYDLTLDATSCDVHEFQRFLNEWAKKWTFQKEAGGTTGYEHYQARLHLHVKQRENEIIAKTAHLWPGKSRRWSITSKTCHQGQDFNYVMKADTRIEGPWTDKDFEEPPKLTRQLRDFAGKELYAWQAQVKAWCYEEDDRSIKLVYDSNGNAGKSIFAEYLEYHGLAYEIPPFRQMEEIMQVVMSIKDKKAYLIDMPRGMKKDKLGEFYSGLEALKNGIAYEKRYHFKKKRMDRPQVIVFTNMLPAFEFLSLDRWQVFEMMPDHTLKKRVINTVINAICSPP